MLKPADIIFPVYPIKLYEKIYKGSRGALLIEDKVGDIWILDDLGKEGNFGQRRFKLKLQLANSDMIKFYPLKKSCSNWAEFLQTHRKTLSKTYIDSTGKLFKYSPQQFVRLQYYKIKRVQVVEGSHSYLIVEGLSQKIRVPRPPPLEVNWAGLLHSTTGLLLYEYSVTKRKDSTRKI